MTKITCYYSHGKRKAKKICKAFAEGCGAELHMADGRTLQEGAAVFYGTSHHTLPLIERCKKEKRDWYYIDNAYYFGRGDYFRVTKNKFMHDGSGQSSSKRFDEFGIELEPWRKKGKYVLITTQSSLFHQFYNNADREVWVRSVKGAIRNYTRRPIEVSWKPEHVPSNIPHNPNFEQLIEDAWALVTFSSSTAVGAIMKGIPTFVLGKCMASCMSAPLSLIENPYYPENRLQWLYNLADNQWTKDEMISGKCWNDLQQ
jgi:hypothetical protein